MIECPECGRSTDDSTLACAECGALLHRDELKALFQTYKTAEIAKNWAQCVKLLEECLNLVPENSKQHFQFKTRLKKAVHLFNNQPVLPDESKLESSDDARFSQASFTEVERKLERTFAVSAENDSILKKAFHGVTAKLALAVVILWNATLALLTGLSRKRTLISLAVWIASFSLLLGWREALVLGVMIYLHEMGHLLAVQYYGVRFAWPFFVPFVGAFVLHGKGVLESPRKNAVISLGGPASGIVASVFVAVLGIWLELPKFVSDMAKLNILINFMNLTPFWLLDGARLANAYRKKELAFIAAVMLGVAICGMNFFAFAMFCCYAARVTLQNQIAKVLPRSAGEHGGLWDLTVIQAALMAFCAASLRTFFD